MFCRLCHHKEFDSLIDLDTSPLSNGYLTKKDLNKGEMWFPLHAMTCKKCGLTQLDEFERPDAIFNKDYAYYSSQSASFVEHAKNFVEKIQRNYSVTSVIEIASNDGYLLQHFDQRDVDVLGIEPSAGCAMEASVGKGIPTVAAFWNSNLAQQVDPADLIVGNNVLAHVPDLNDFIIGVRTALNPEGIATFEFPYLGDLVNNLQFDTIYHEHFSYFSFAAVCKAFARNDMFVFDVEHIPVHGGSLRIYVTHARNLKYNYKCTGNSRSDRLMLEESNNPIPLSRFSKQVHDYKLKIINHLLEEKICGRKIVIYGAAAKGNTLLNYCGIGKDIIDYAVDTTPAKQGKYLPGSRIPIHHPDILAEDKPDLIWILPWNWKHEIMKKLEFTKEWGADFLVKDGIC